MRVFRYPGKLTFRLNLGSHLLLHILQSGRDYVLISRSSSSKAMFPCGGHSHLEGSMGNMCLASEVNNALVIFPGTEMGFCTHSRLLTTTAEPSHRHIGVCGHIWAHCGLLAVLRVGTQYNSEQDWAQGKWWPWSWGPHGAVATVLVSLSQAQASREKEMWQTFTQLQATQELPAPTSHPHPVCCCSPISNTVVTVQACHEARGAGKQSKLLRCSELWG